MCFLCQELIEQSNNTQKHLESWDLNLAQIKAEPNLALLICIHPIGFLFACQELIL